MLRDDVIHALRQRQQSLQQQGVMHATLFGSVARGDFDANSDIDVALYLSPDHRMSLFDISGIGGELESSLGRSVHITTPKSNVALIEEIRKEGVHAF